MKKLRVIPIILFKDGRVVQSNNFKIHRPVGTPTVIIDRLSAWNCDEVVCLDISRSKNNFSNREDLNFKTQKDFPEVIRDISKHCFMPLTAGGKIKKVSDAIKYIESGADKISINSIVHNDKNFLSTASKILGSQCLVVSIDVKKIDGKWKIFSENGKKLIDRDLQDYINYLSDSGAGEILINSIDEDGKGNGYDIDLFLSIKNKVKLPIIALGGVGKWEHFEEIIKYQIVDAVAAANIFHFTENSYFNALKYLYDQNINIRKNYLSNLSIYKI